VDQSLQRSQALFRYKSVTGCFVRENIPGEKKKNLSPEKVAEVCLESERHVVVRHYYHYRQTGFRYYSRNEKALSRAA
jgi:hypothetical protein